MSGPPRLVNLTFLYFQITKAVDSGHVASVDAAHDALLDGQAMEFLDQYDEIDLSMYKDFDKMEADTRPNDDKPQGWDWNEMNAMFERYASADPRDLGVENNGLLYVMAEIVELIQNHNWNHPVVGSFNQYDLEIESDW